MNGRIIFLLHAHLPYIRHPEQSDYLEENWLFEAIAESYIPLLEVFNRLIDENRDYKLIISISSTLISMLSDELLKNRFIKYLDNLIDLSKKEKERKKNNEIFFKLAEFYYERYKKIKNLYINHYNRDLISAFKKIHELGKAVIITSSATHAFLPLLDVNKIAVKVQMKQAVLYFKEKFGFQPDGIWLPECGYYPGHDIFIKENGLKYFFTEIHGILHSKPAPRYGIYSPIKTKNNVYVFGRDIEASKDVWSSEEGYPGAPVYRDFYRDIGYEADYSYIKPYLGKDAIRKQTGIKYWAITGKNIEKKPYDISEAIKQAEADANDFYNKRLKQFSSIKNSMDGRLPLIVIPFDAELFGHWWFEGPEWIYYLFRRLTEPDSQIRLSIASEYINDDIPLGEPAFSSWGYKGYADVWLNNSNDWIYKHLHLMADRMVKLAKKFPNASGSLERALNQAARELLLAQSSDWAFILKTGTVVDYAVKRIKEHILRFNKLYEDIIADNINLSWLEQIEYRDNIFPNIDYRIYGEAE